MSVVKITEGSSNKLLFIDVDEKPLAVVKEEQPSPEEKDSSTKTNNIKCVECTYTSTSAERMTRHIRTTHRGEKPYQCSWCHYGTTNSVMYKEHINMHQGVKPYQCSQCPYRSVSKKYIKLHEQKHGKCSNCGFVANNRPALRRHLRENLCSSTDTDPKTYYCEPCGTSYKDAFALRVHKKNHRKCTYCNKTVTKDGYNEHLKKVHGVNNKELKKFRCKLCDFSTMGPQKIMLHLIHHPNQEVDGFDITPLVKAGILVGVE